MASQTSPTQDADIYPVSLTAERVEPKRITRRWVHRFLRHRMAVIGLTMLVLIALYVVLGSFIFTEANANFNNTKLRLQAPTQEYPFGTDTIGRNILARTIYGGQISLIIGIVSVAVSVSVGMTVGILAGYFGGWIDGLLMRLTEAMLCIPQLLLLLVIAKFLSQRIPDLQLFGRTFSGSVIVIILVIGLTGWMYLARIVRSGVLSVKQSEFVVAAQALGAPNWRIIAAHILPNILAPVIVSATLGIAGAILAESYVSFLGLGVQAPTATWGNMLDGSRQYLAEAPWLWLAPGVLILLTVMSINFVGDGLRDALDPRSDHNV